MTGLSKFPFLFLVINFSVLVFPVQTVTDKHEVHTRTIGPFTIGKDHQLTVFARITHVHLRSYEADGWPDSDTLLIIIDSSGRKLFQRSAETTLGSASTDFDCGQLNIPTIGNVLICTSSDAPTVADNGEEFQFFSVNSKGKFVPITSRIGQSSYKLVFLDSRTKQKPVSVDSSLAYAKPAIEVEFYSGYYYAKVYFHIYPEGFLEAKQRDVFHFDQIPVIVDTKETDRTRKMYQKQDTQVLLFPIPATDTSHAHIVTVRPNSQIKYLYSSYVHDWWLYVSIDGRKGFVSNDDCSKLGFFETDGSPVMLGDDY
jgi:hypothetical protein